MDKEKKLTLPENVFDTLVNAYPKGFVLVGRCENGQMRKFLANPKEDPYLEKLFEIADCVDKEGNVNIQEQDEGPEFS
jgi:hypothetical protein